MNKTNVLKYRRLKSDTVDKKNQMFQNINKKYSWKLIRC